MSLTIDLAPSEEQRLTEQAAREGLAAADYVRRLIQSSLESAAREAKARRAAGVLRGWIDQARANDGGEPDEAAQIEAHEWEAAVRAVDEDRLSYRRRFADLASDTTPGASP